MSRLEMVTKRHKHHPTPDGWAKDEAWSGGILVPERGEDAALALAFYLTKYTFQRLDELPGQPALEPVANALIAPRVTSSHRFIRGILSHIQLCSCNVVELIPMPFNVESAARGGNLSALQGSARPVKLYINLGPSIPQRLVQNQN